MSSDEREQYRRGRDYSRRPGHWRNDPELVRRYHASLTVRCRYCHRSPGFECVHVDAEGRPTDTPLARIPYHPIRHTDSERPKQL